MMKKGWKKIRLGEIVKINPDSIKKDFEYSTIEYVDISSVGTGTIERPQKIKLSEAPSRAKRIIKKGDIILSTVRPNRRSFYFFKQAKKNLIVSTGFAVLRAMDTNSRFVYYLINHQEFTDYLTNSAKGAAYPAVDSEIINRAEFIIPESITEQQKIATTLSNYDDLIENNTERIKLLENIAKLIYEEWFVKFKFPGHEKVKMVDSELGKLPEGWDVKEINEFCEFVSRGVTPKYELGSKKFIINQKVNKGFNLELQHLKELSNELIVPKEKFALNGDILINSLGEGTIGRIHYYNTGDKLFAIDQHMSICRSSKLENTFYLYFYLSSEKGQKWIESVKTGGTNMTMLNISTLRKCNVLLPKNEVLNHFYNLIKPLLNFKSKLESKNQNLSKTRDLLLPRLITGKVDVSELDIQVEVEA
jgi:type I restriction enzyme, S subunit